MEVRLGRAGVCSYPRPQSPSPSLTVELGLPEKFLTSMLTLKNSSPSCSRIIVASAGKADSNGPLSSPGTASSSSRAPWPSSSAIIALAVLAVLLSSAAPEADLFRLSDLVKYLGCSSDLLGTGVD